MGEINLNMNQFSNMIHQYILQHMFLVIDGPERQKRCPNNSLAMSTFISTYSQLFKDLGHFSTFEIVQHPGTL